MAGNNNLITRLIFEAEDRASDVITKIGVALETYFAVDKISGFFSSAVSGAADLEKQFSTLQAATEATGEDIARLQAKAEELGASDALSVSAVQAAQGMTELGRAGQSTEQILASITPVMALAQGAAMDLGTAAGIVTANLAGFSLSADQAGRVADVLSTAASSAKTTVKELADALSYAAPSANAAGMSLEETTAIIAKMQNAGIDASRAGTALNAMLASLADPASTASKALDKAGISTRDFSEVLAEIEQGGPAAEAAIVGFGTEAGPALQALLAQGSAGVRELQAALDQSGGSAEKAAATMNDNLAGAVEAVGSVWEGLKTTLAQPLLEPLEREARALAATLADFPKSAQMEQLKQVLVSTFETGAAQLRAFAGAVDWPAFAQSVSNGLNGTLESIRTWGENISNVKDTVVLAFASIGTGLSTLSAGFFGLAGVVSQVVSIIIDGFARIIEAQSKLTFGPLKTMMQDTANEISALSESFATSAEVNFGRAQEALEQAAARGETLRAAWERLNAPTQEVAANVQDLATAQEQASEKSQALIDAEQALEQALTAYNAALTQAQSGQDATGTSLVDLGRVVAEAQAKVDALTSGAQQAAPAIESVGQAAADTRTPIEQASQQINALEIAYQAFLSVGDTQQAAKIRQQIDDIKDSLSSTSDEADKTSEAVASAFRVLGVTSQAELDQLAETAKAAFETIQASGTAAPADIQNAFTAYATAAIAANGGVADSTIQAQAAQLGLSVVASEAGDKIIAASEAAATAVDQVAQASESAADGLSGMGDAAEDVSSSADSAADSVSDLGEETEKTRGYTITTESAMRDYGASMLALGEYADVAKAAFVETYKAMQGLWDSVSSRDSFYHALNRIYQSATDAANAAALLAKQADDLDEKLSALNDDYDNGTVGLAEYTNRLQALRSQYYQLGEEDLAAVSDALADARAEQESLTSSALSGLSSWKAKLYEIKGQQVELQKLNWQEDKLETELALAEAKRNNNAEEIAALQEQLALINEYYAIKVAEAELSEREAAAEKQTSSNTSSSTTDTDATTPATNTAEPTRTVNVNITTPSGQRGTVRVLEGDEDTLESLLRSLEAGQSVT